ncbi:MAG: alpha/beta hydrolase family protein [Bacteroidota bacterium]
MKRLTYFCLLFLPLLSYAQGSTLLESLTCGSKILEKEVAYSIYLPAGYEASSRRYPVLYLLHGYTDDETAWTQFGEVKKIADQAMQDARVTDMIIVMPDAGVDWYVNSYDTKTRYEDFFIEELIPFVESNYRIRSEKQFRALAGLSMGGHGTLLYAIKYPELFAAAAPLSASVWTEQSVMEIDQKGWDEYFGFIYGPELAGEARLTPHLRQSNTLFLLQDLSEEGLQQLREVKFYIDCGDDDFLIEGNMELHAEMRKLEIPHEFRVRDGAHNWTYWRTALPTVLSFISERFHR